MNWINHTDSGYRYFKPIFWLLLLGVCGILVYYLNLNHWDMSEKLYVKCLPEPGQLSCVNPLKQTQYANKCIEGWCSQDLLAPGEYGTKPPEDWIYNHLGSISFWGFVIAFLLNHFLFNWGKMPDFNFVLWGKRRVSMSTAIKNIDEKKGDDDEDSDSDFFK